MDNAAEWRYDWFKRTSASSAVHILTYNETDDEISISEEGIYNCRGRRGDTTFFTEDSNLVTIENRGKSQFRNPKTSYLRYGGKILSLYVSFFICLSAGLRKNYWKLLLKLGTEPNIQTFINTFTEQQRLLHPHVLFFNNFWVFLTDLQFGFTLELAAADCDSWSCDSQSVLLTGDGTHSLSPY